MRSFGDGLKENRGCPLSPCEASTWEMNALRVWVLCSLWLRRGAVRVQKVLEDFYNDFLMST